MRIQKHHRWTVGIVSILVIVLIASGIILALLRPWEAATPTANTNTQNSPNNPPDKTSQQLTCIQRLPLQTKLGQKLMIAGYASTLSSEQPSMAVANLNGVLIMDETPSPLIESFKTAFTITPTVAVDQEGGPFNATPAKESCPVLLI